MRPVTLLMVSTTVPFTEWYWPVVLLGSVEVELVDILEARVDSNIVFENWVGPIERQSGFYKAVANVIE